MSRDTLLDELHQRGFFLKDGRTNPQALKKLEKEPNLKKKLIETIPFFHQCVSFAQIVHALKHNLDDIPKCPVCQSYIKFDRPSSTYPATCSPKCGAKYSPTKTFKVRDVTKEPGVLDKRINSRQRNYRTGIRANLNNKTWLYKNHVQDKLSITEISQRLKTTPTTVKRALVKFNIVSPSQQELREATNLRRYGVKNPGLLPETREKAKASEYGKRIGGWKSSGEKEVLSFIQSLFPDNIILENSQRIISPHELDIYVPSHKIAIEYCGLYWHSDKFKKNYYHRDKLRECQKKGIRLITLFEDEWNNKRKIVESKIKNILGCDDRNRVYARKTTITRVSQQTKNDFFNQYHIQGTGPGSITYGLIYNNNLVAAITFIKRSNGVYELNRYATSVNVIGGFSKLLKHFQRNYGWSKIVSFADLRWSEGHLYESTGWCLDRVLPPDYYWCKNGQRWHKFGFRHKHLAQKLSTYDPMLSENQNCKLNGYVKLYNCGLKRYVLTSR